MSFTITTTEYLEVNGVPLATPAWQITNLLPEMVSGATLRGSDIVIPHATGVLANKRRITATVKQFHMQIFPFKKWDNTAYTDRLTGLMTNTEYLTANLGLAYATGDGTVTATWHRQDATTKSASVTVTSFTTRDLGMAIVEGVLELSVRDGVFS